MKTCASIFSLCCAVCCLLSGSSGPVMAEELKIGFWNVENLLDEYDDPLLPYDEKFSSNAVRERLGKDAEVIRNLNVDILGLSEVENLPLLKRLVSGYLKNEGYNTVVLIEGADPRGIDVALLSRIPCLVQAVEIEGLPRDILVARFQMKGQVFYVLVNHWKSRLNGEGEDVRLNGAKAAAQFATREIIALEGRKVPVVVVGDFNDEPEDVSLKHLEQQGLVNTMLSMPKDKRWTLGYYNRDASRMDLLCFDQILISPDLKQPASRLRWKKTEVRRPTFMINSRRSFNGVNVPLPLDDYQDRIGYSDHFPVVATFELD